MVQLHHHILLFFQEALSIAVEVENGNDRPISHCHNVTYMQEASNPPMDYKLHMEAYSSKN